MLPIGPSSFGPCHQPNIFAGGAIGARPDVFERVCQGGAPPISIGIGVPAPTTPAQEWAQKSSDKMADAAVMTASTAIGTAIAPGVGTAAGIVIGAVVVGLGSVLRGR